MDKQKLYENVEKHLIGLDDEFRFKCRECGKCCKNRDDILLSPLDIYKMMHKLELSSVEFLSRYCEPYITPDGNFSCWWFNTVAVLSDYVRSVDAMNSKRESTLDRLWSFLALMLYVKYDLSTDFLSQFTRNIAEVSHMLFSIDKAHCENFRNITDYFLTICTCSEVM